jgi:hypothetical protein
MYEGLLHLHSALRWVILILLLLAIFKSLGGKTKAFTPGHRKTGLFLMISADIMLLVGLYQWFAGDWGLKSIQNNGMSTVMKNSVLRFFAIEHLTAMLIAIILIHIGYAHAKKNIPDEVKHKRTVLFYGLALLLILIAVPWPFRLAGSGRTWFPGM